jgi:hypothetical protein
VVLLAVLLDLLLRLEFNAARGALEALLLYHSVHLLSESDS